MPIWKTILIRVSSIDIEIHSTDKETLNSVKEMAKPRAETDNVKVDDKWLDGWLIITGFPDHKNAVGMATFLAKQLKANGWKDYSIDKHVNGFWLRKQES